jgi:hypothetical protein
MDKRGLFMCIVVAVGATAATTPERIFKGGEACDGSAVVSVGTGFFLNANDEDNFIRLYSTSGKKLRAWDWNQFLNTERNKRGHHKEADIEAVARIGNRLYWVGSHGRDKDGNAESSRHRFFATDLTGTGRDVDLKAAGDVYTDLLKKVLASHSSIAGPLAAAEKLPHQKGGIDIEGMAATPQGSLLIGFRSPLIGGKALLLELLNPAELVEKGLLPRFAEPVLIDLGGLGIRDLASRPEPGAYYVIAGQPGAGNEYKLFVWRPSDNIARPAPFQLPEGGDWEGIALDGRSSGRVIVASDDGEAGSPKCKDSARTERTFRFSVLTAR